MSDIAEEAARKAVSETFLLFNVDVNDTESREKFQRDMMFMRDLRQTSDTVKGGVMKTLIGLVVGGAAIALWKGLPWGGMH